MNSKLFKTLPLVIVANAAQTKVAYCEVKPQSGVATYDGLVDFTQVDPTGSTATKTTISGKFTGMDASASQGFHIHTNGELTNDCTDAGGHYNPAAVDHAAPTETTHHVGDLGNLAVDSSGNAAYSVVDDLVQLYGDTSVVGRSCVLHSGTDDLGLGGDSGSLASGNAGTRVACGLIQQYPCEPPTVTATTWGEKAPISWRIGDTASTVELPMFTIVPSTCALKYEIIIPEEIKDIATANNSKCLVTFDSQKGKPGKYEIILTAKTPKGYELTNAVLKVPVLIQPVKKNVAEELLQVAISVGVSAMGVNSMQMKPQMKPKGPSFKPGKPGPPPPATGGNNFDISDVKPAKADGKVKPAKADGKGKPTKPAGEVTFDSEVKPEKKVDIETGEDAEAKAGNSLFAKFEI